MNRKHKAWVMAVIKVAPEDMKVVRDIVINSPGWQQSNEGESVVEIEYDTLEHSEVAADMVQMIVKCETFTFETSSLMEE